MLRILLFTWLFLMPAIDPDRLGDQVRGQPKSDLDQLGELLVKTHQDLDETRDTVASILNSIVAHMKESDNETFSVREDLTEINRKLQARVDELELSLKSIRSDWAEANSLMLQIPEFDRATIRAERLHVVRDRIQENVYLAKNEPVLIEFEANILTGYKPKGRSIAIEREDRHIVVYLQGEMPPEGIPIICCLENGKFIALRLREADSEHLPDVKVQVGVN
ncbi:MAG: hypothetical protein U0136_08240 [Bdellovibrionota bacterium]